MSVWNFWAKFYDRLWVQHVSLRPTRRNVVEKLKGKLPKSARVLDVGCGIGELLCDVSILLASENSRSEIKPFLLGIDASPGMIDRARQCHPELAFKVWDVSELSALTEASVERFDAVMCTHSLPYYDTPDKVLCDMAEVLIPGGLLIMAQASSNSIYDAMALSMVKLTTGKASYYSIEVLKQLAEKRFDILSVDRVRTAWFMPAIVMLTLKSKIKSGGALQ